jgi:2'-5' RNA ligase
MAEDHFKIHSYMKDDKVDWNFNILFNDLPQVNGMAERYAKLLDHPGLYPPVPPQWLHLTILRVGFTVDFTESEMQAVASRLRPKLASLKLPEFTLGPAWVYKGYPLLHIAPEEPLDQIFQIVVRELKAVVGEDRMPHPVDRPITKLVPHVSLAYTRKYDSEDEVQAILTDNPIPPVLFRPSYLSLVKQRPLRQHYEWEVIENIPLGAKDSSLD